MAKAERILLTEPGVRLDMNVEEATSLRDHLYCFRANQKFSEIYLKLMTALSKEEDE